jgi:hypothetical protein
LEAQPAQLAYAVSRICLPLLAMTIASPFNSTASLSVNAMFNRLDHIGANKAFSKVQAEQALSLRQADE